MLTVKDAKDLMEHHLVEQIDGLIKHHAVQGYSSFQITVGKYEKEIWDKVIAEYEERGWKVDRSCSGFLSFSW